MDIDKIKPGRVVGYQSIANAGRARVVGTHTGKTGVWVTLLDEKRRKTVTVRPSQVSR
jgi:hypothetical protein